MSRSRATCLGPFSPDTLTKRAGHISSQDYNVSTVYNVHTTLIFQTFTCHLNYSIFFILPSVWFILLITAATSDLFDEL